MITVKNLWFSYDAQVILEDVNLTIKQGEFIAVIGPNGGGKTTLIKLILGILKPQRGEITVLGQPPKTAARRMGYVPQNTNISKVFPISVMDVALMGRLGKAGRSWRYSEADRRRAEEALDRVGMLEHKKSPVLNLSGGQRQRVFIARALASDPEILFMDEPTASVDQEWQAQIYNLLKELNKSITIVVVSHDISILSSYVKSVACVNRTVYYHDAAEITEEMLGKMYQCPVELVAHGVPHRVLQSH
ncbi:MAG TPA: ABC transporter ATP-binding protein [Candidatus Sumerlaeota bacterium]|nr:ABC transporter ATP-binding protein [Candidatus Sumerlaeota bacterium]HON49253.1 ABC transporter ATP-binding protein [Candidatus Sumerlaeota bacterium]HOR64140.1 ABC transporter ATP-binding protein [Candidatus Sumerlaeota bacterium]HPL73153.1 ABC transporter ATP-binding protein [Candidatus Sumerlaeota bacterium]HRU53498.1 ABC transporter ATP-binding protein [Candidatus Sumerlaeia bacterium]